jgi:hypothetical protein
MDASGTGLASPLLGFPPLGDVFMSMLELIVAIVLFMALLGSLPTWPHSRNWGYAPSGTLGLILAVIIVLVLMGRL